MKRSLRRHYEVASHGASGVVRNVDLAPREGRLRADIDGREVRCDARVLRSLAGGADLVLTLGGGRHRALVVRDGDVVHVAIDGRTYRLRAVTPRHGAETVGDAGGDPFAASPMTGVVRQVLVEPGARVAAGGTLVVVEAMKMEFTVEAPRDLVVDEVRAKPGDRVEISQVLVTFGVEPAA